ncbi:MAG: TetR/AcrR family transcriptional regulator [Bacteroidales bacterium]|jgi:AcrR family transcriptional regulator|nr:TetR/AcrR family transcriptional regulator [Bacteroidales bacterium]
MQIQKSDIRKKILETSRKEFLEKGFKGTSMRSISEKSGVVLSNIYNYFRNKDVLFREVLSGLLDAVDNVAKTHNSDSNIDLYVFDSEEYVKSQITMFVDLIHHYKEDFKLLLFGASGSSLENYREKCIDRYTEMGKEYIEIVNKKYPDINSNISYFFIHILSSWWISIVSELVMHDLSYDELQKFIYEYMEYATAGWKRIMNVKE